MADFPASYVSLPEGTQNSESRIWSPEMHFPRPIIFGNVRFRGGGGDAYITFLIEIHDDDLELIPPTQ